MSLYPTVHDAFARQAFMEVRAKFAVQANVKHGSLQEVWEQEDAAPDPSVLPSLKMNRRSHARTRPVPVVGRCYRNGPGQVRRLTDIVFGKVHWVVEKSGPGAGSNGKESQHPVGHKGVTTMKSFRTWLTHECEPDGTIVHHDLKAPKADVSNIKAAFREAIESARKII